MSDLKIYGRIMHPHLHQPHAFKPGDDAKFSAVIVLAENDSQIERINAEAWQMFIAKFGQGIQPQPDHWILKKDTTGNANLNGHLKISAKSQNVVPVSMYDSSGAIVPVLDQGRPADGDWCWFAIKLFDYNKPAPGISCWLNLVLFDKPGEGKLGTGGAPDPTQFWQGTQATHQPAGGTPQTPTGMPGYGQQAQAPAQGPPLQGMPQGQPGGVPGGQPMPQQGMMPQGQQMPQQGMMPQGQQMPQQGMMPQGQQMPQGQPMPPQGGQWNPAQGQHPQ